MRGVAEKGEGRRENWGDSAMVVGGIDAPHYFENIFILAAGGGDSSSGSVCLDI